VLQTILQVVAKYLVNEGEWRSFVPEEVLPPPEWSLTPKHLL